MYTYTTYNNGDFSEGRCKMALFYPPDRPPPELRTARVGRTGVQPPDPRAFLSRVRQAAKHCEWLAEILGKMEEYHVDNGNVMREWDLYMYNV